MQLWIYTIVIVTVIHATCALDLFTSTACFGTLPDSVVHASCAPGHVVAVKNLRAMAKQRTDACPDTVTSDNETTLGENCCVYEDTDCGARYYGSDYTDFYSACHGNQSCSYPVRRVDTERSTSCAPEVYTTNTSYMILEYNCIPVTNILSPCESLVANSTSVYLWNSGYPNEIVPGSDECECSVEVSCSTNIQIIALDTRFQRENGDCKQKLIVNERDELHDIDCTSNNAFRLKTVYTSSYFYFTFTLSNNLSDDGGNVWIQISGSDNQAEMTIACGSETKSQLSASGGKVLCGTNVTDPSTLPTLSTVSTVDPTSVTEETGHGETRSQDDDPPVNSSTESAVDTGEDTSIVLAIILLAALLVCLGILLGIICWKRDAIKRQLCAEKGKVEDSASLSASEHTTSERSSPVYDTMPAGEALIPASADTAPTPELPALPGDDITERKQQLEPLFPGQRFPPMDNRIPLSSIGTVQDLPENEEDQIYPIPFRRLEENPMEEMEHYEMSRLRPITAISQHHLPPIDSIGSHRMKPRLALLSMIMSEHSSVSSLSPVESYSDVYSEEHVSNRRRRHEMTAIDYEPYRVPTASIEKTKIRKKKKRLMRKMNEPYETGYPHVYM